MWSTVTPPSSVASIAGDTPPRASSDAGASDATDIAMRSGSNTPRATWNPSPIADTPGVMPGTPPVPHYQDPFYLGLVLEMEKLAAHSYESRMSYMWSRDLTTSMPPTPEYNLPTIQRRTEAVVVPNDGMIYRLYPATHSPGRVQDMIILPPLPAPFTSIEVAWILKRGGPGGNFRFRKSLKFWMEAAADFNVTFESSRSGSSLRAKFMKLVGGTRVAKARSKVKAAALVGSK